MVLGLNWPRELGMFVPRQYHFPGRVMPIWNVANLDVQLQTSLGHEAESLMGYLLLHLSMFKMGFLGLIIYFFYDFINQTLKTMVK